MRHIGLDGSVWPRTRLSSSVYSDLPTSLAKAYSQPSCSLMHQRSIRWVCSPPKCLLTNHISSCQCVLIGGMISKMAACLWTSSAQDKNIKHIPALSPLHFLFSLLAILEFVPQYHLLRELFLDPQLERTFYSPLSLSIMYSAVYYFLLPWK